MSYRAAYNVLDRPVPVDDEGRTLEGGGWGTIDATSEAGKAAIDQGNVVLVDLDTDAPGLNLDALRAVNEAGRLEERRQALTELTKAELEALAREHDLLGAAEEVTEGDNLRKRELVAVLVRRPEVDPAETPPAPTEGKPATTTTRRRGGNQ